MTLRKTNEALSEAVGLLAEKKSGLDALINEVVKAKGFKLGKWVYNKPWKLYLKWNLIRKSDGILMRVQKVDKDKKPFPKGSDKGDAELFVKVRHLGGGRYEFDHGKVKNSLADAERYLWSVWKRHRED